MRTFGVFLLLLNVGLFAWQYNRHVETVTRDALERPRLQPGLPGLVLLREMDALPELRSPAPAAPDSDIAAELIDDVEGADLCMEVGPFGNAAARDGFRDWLRELVAAIHTRSETVRKRQLFWVYLEPSSDEVARDSIADLRDRGVEDTMLIRRGGLKNAISLGLFSSQDSVNRRLAELNEQGYKPVVVPRFETTERYWIRAQMRAGYDALPEAPPSLIGDGTLKQIRCRTLATAETPGMNPAESDRIPAAPEVPE